MKKFKAILALVLVACLFVTLFAACSSNEETPNTNTNTNTDANTNTENNNTNTESEGEVEVDFDEDPTELKVVLYDMRSTGADYGDPVEAHANEITKNTINIVCDYIWVGPGDWQSKVNVALSGGERFDVMNLSPMTRASALYPQGLLTPMDEYLQYAPEAYELVKEYIGAYTFGGNVYGFPTIRNYCKNAYILMRTDVLEELGMVEQAEAIDSWSDYEAILAAVKENVTDKGGMAAIGMSYPYADYNFCAGDSFADSFAPDTAGDPFQNTVLYVEQDDPTIKNIQASKYYKFAVETANRWWDAGYYWADSGITTEFIDDAMKQDLFFSQICGSETGVEVTKEGAMGFDLTVVQVNTGMIKTAQPSFTGICVPITCEEPEAAVMWINELYTNPDLMMALVWGVEGSDYTIEAGEVHHVDKGYLNVDFLLGNNTLLTPLAGNGADFYEIVKKTNEEAVKSRYLGFVFDTTDLDLVMSQITAVVDQYYKVIPYGGLDQLDAYIAALEKAGINDLIAADQAQLDAWLAANEG